MSDAKKPSHENQRSIEEASALARNVMKRMLATKPKPHNLKTGSTVSKQKPRTKG